MGSGLNHGCCSCLDPCALRGTGWATASERGAPWQPLDHTHRWQQASRATASPQARAKAPGLQAWACWPSPQPKTGACRRLPLTPAYSSACSRGLLLQRPMPGRHQQRPHAPSATGGAQLTRRKAVADGQQVLDVTLLLLLPAAAGDVVRHPLRAMRGGGGSGWVSLTRSRATVWWGKQCPFAPRVRRACVCGSQLWAANASG
jgi:hypothetical protein